MSANGPRSFGMACVRWFCSQCRNGTGRRPPSPEFRAPLCWVTARPHRGSSRRLGILTFLLAQVLTASVFARSVSEGSGKVTGVKVGTSSPMVFVKTAKRGEGKPGCSDSPYFDFAFNGSTPGGRTVVAQVLTAYATGRSVKIRGTGLCPGSTHFEGLDFVELE